MRTRSEIKVAIVHYWFLARGGGERVVEVLAEMFPQADLFCLVADPRRMTPALQAHRLTTSFLQKVPGSRRWHRHFLPLQPLALEQLDLSGYDLILSSESGPAKGVISSADTCHICYCHSPMRYLWDMYAGYRRALGPMIGAAFALTANYLRLWDVAAASRVDHFVANSQNVASRIYKHYRRQASVVYPPVEVAAGQVFGKIDDYYLVVSRLTDYKRVDLAVQACTRLGRRLRVIGDGSLYKQLRAQAGPTVEFLGHIDDRGVRENYAHCRALLFPGEEDFGLVPVEAQSFGRPVIAFGQGGALETVIGFSPDEGSAASCSGVFFPAPTAESLAEAIRTFESAEADFSPEFIRASVQRFGVPRFKEEMEDYIAARMAEHHTPRYGTTRALSPVY